MNTLENKAKFFALYWGQEIMKQYESDLEETVYATTPHAMQSKMATYYLQLKPLSSITDEDAIEVVKRLYNQPIDCLGRQQDDRVIVFFNNGTELYIYYDQGFLGYTEGDVEVILTDELGAWDYLRTKSYAIDWNGISVEQMIEWGWIKIVE